MAGTGGGDRNRSTETRDRTVDAREELKRTLDRDTAVQGEREEDTAQTSRGPAGADSSPTTTRPAPPGRDTSK